MRTPAEFRELLGLVHSQGDCGRKTISIYPDGSVKPCQFIQEYTLGDLRRQSIRQILNPGNRVLRLFAEQYKHLRGPKCSRCPFKEVCGGGSRGRARLAGDFWGDDPLCFINPWEIAGRWLAE